MSETIYTSKGPLETSNAIEPRGGSARHTLPVVIEKLALSQVSRERTCNGCWKRAGAFELWTLCPTDLS